MLRASPFMVIGNPEIQCTVSEVLMLVGFGNAALSVIR
jgi:hypothetical protein